MNKYLLVLLLVLVTVPQFIPVRSYEDAAFRLSGQAHSIAGAVVSVLGAAGATLENIGDILTPPVLAGGGRGAGDNQYSLNAREGALSVAK